MSKKYVCLLGLSFEIFEFLQDIGEVILQVPLQGYNIILVHSEELVCLIHGSGEHCVTGEHLKFTIQKPLKKFKKIMSVNVEFQWSTYNVV